MRQRSPDRARRATIQDVARLAGVSTQTVSRVVNDHAAVRESTRTKVRDAVQQLRYRPNVAARAMVNGRTRNLGLITTGSTDYGPTSTTLSLMSAARQARYTVTVATAGDSEPESLRVAAELVVSQHVEAVVVVASSTRMLDGLASVSFDVPVVVIDSSGRASHPVLSIDQYAGARLATEHLVGLGHSEIVHVMGPVDAMDATERLRGWRDVMAEHGLVARSPLVGDWSPRSGFRLGTELTRGGVPFTAIFAANDQMALGCLHALRLVGRYAPHDVSVIGFDDLPEVEHVWPPLTTMRQDFNQLGVDVLETVLGLVGAAPLSSRLQHTPELIVRESTGPVMSPPRG